MAKLEELKLAVEWAEFNFEQSIKALEQAKTDAEDARITLKSAYRELRKSESTKPLEE